MSLLSPDDIAYLRQQAGSRGYNADDLLKVIQYESSGRPDVWGGKDNKYFGLLQFGGPERAQFGVNTQNPSAQNQIDAAFKFLQARGFKPGMGLLDLYSTVNAGSPGHYNASDRPGMTVAKHVAAMGGQSVPQGQIPGSSPVLAANLGSEPVQGGILTGSLPHSEDDTPLIGSEPQADDTAIRGLLAQLMPQQPQVQQSPQLPQDVPEAPAYRPRARGLAFQQLTVRTPKFSKG